MRSSYVLYKTVSRKWLVTRRPVLHEEGYPTGSSNKVMFASACIVAVAQIIPSYSLEWRQCAPNQIYIVPCAHASLPPKGISTVQPFCRDHRWVQYLKDTQTTERATCMAIDRIYAMHAMQPKTLKSRFFSKIKTFSMYGTTVTAFINCRLNHNSLLSLLGTDLAMLRLFPHPQKIRNIMASSWKEGLTVVGLREVMAECGGDCGRDRLLRVLLLLLLLLQLISFSHSLHRRQRIPRRLYWLLT